MWSFSSSPAPCSPPCTLITAQAPPHLLSFLKSSSSQPQECQAILSGSSASPFLFSHVRMCHSTELCRYMLGGWCFFFFSSICTRSADKWFKNKTGSNLYQPTRSSKTILLLLHKDFSLLLAFCPCFDKC